MKAKRGRTKKSAPKLLNGEKNTNTKKAKRTDQIKKNSATRENRGGNASRVAIKKALWEKGGGQKKMGGGGAWGSPWGVLSSVKKFLPNRKAIGGKKSGEKNVVTIAGEGIKGKRGAKRVVGLENRKKWGSRTLLRVTRIKKWGKKDVQNRVLVKARRWGEGKTKGEKTEKKGSKQREGQERSREARTLTGKRDLVGSY